MKIQMNKLAIIILSVIFGGILLTIGVDLWTTTSTKTPSKIATGDNAGIYNPQDIRGSYTFAEVADTFEIDVKILFDAFNIPEDTDPTDIQNKDLEGMFENSGVEVGNESMQVFVALYKKLPVTLEDSYLPNAAVKLLLELGKLDEAQKTYFETHKVDLSNLAADDNTKVEPSELSEKSGEAVKEEEEHLVKGSTTFQQVLNAGISEKQIKEVLNAPMPPTNQTIRTYCSDNGVSFSEIKDQLNLLAE